jgi:hypothetical protein
VPVLLEGKRMCVLICELLVIVCFLMPLGHYFSFFVLFVFVYEKSDKNVNMDCNVEENHRSRVNGSSVLCFNMWVFVFFVNLCHLRNPFRFGWFDEESTCVQVLFFVCQFLQKICSDASQLSVEYSSVFLFLKCLVLK